MCRCCHESRGLLPGDKVSVVVPAGADSCLREPAQALTGASYRLQSRVMWRGGEAAWFLSDAPGVLVPESWLQQVGAANLAA